MVNGMALLALLVVSQAANTDPAAAALDSSIRQALKTGDYPWYDAAKDQLEPVQPPWKSSWLTRFMNWLDRFNFQWKGSRGNVQFDLGRTLIVLVFIVALVFLLVGLYYAYRAYLPAASGTARGATVGRAAVVGGLPTGLQVDLEDPLGEARRLRAAGDYAAAMLCLFVHLLLRLQEAQLIRLAPGKTARQLVRSITVPAIRKRVEPTLRLFESSYYGHRIPSEGAFEYAWLQAEQFEAELVKGGKA